MMQTVQELPPNLPIQTQLYLIERIAGAVVSVISYTLLAALGVIYMQLNFLLMLMVITGVSFNWIYRASRQAESGRISAFFTAAIFSSLVLVAVALITESLVVGLIQHLFLVPWYGLYKGYQQGIKDVSKDIGNQLNAYYSFPNRFYPFVFKLYEIGDLLIRGQQNFWEVNNSLRRKILEILAYFNAWLEPIAAIPRMEKLQLKLLEDCLSTYNLYEQALIGNNTSTELNRAKIALDFCINIQFKIFEAYHGNRQNQRPPISDELEGFILQEKAHISEFNRILSTQPLDIARLNEWSEAVLGQSQHAADDLNQQSKDIWQNAYLATHPYFLEQRQALLQEALFQSLMSNSMQVLMRQALETARLQSSQQMTESFFNNDFALSPAEQDAIRHTRLSESDREKCRQSQNEKVKNLFALYEETERNLQATCPISLEEPSSQDKVVLVKQYCSNNQTAENRVDDKWLPVPHPNGNVVFDRNALKRLCCIASAQIRHPLDRDPLLPPDCGAYSSNPDSLLPPHRGDTYTYNKTRYRYHPYYQDPNNPNEDEIFSQTLQSVAVELDKLNAVPNFRRTLISKASSTRIALNIPSNKMNYASEPLNSIK